MRSPKFPVGVFIALFALTAALGAEDTKKGPPKSSIQGFLQQYAYYPVPFEWDENEPFMLKGGLNGQRITFLVDTGCRVSLIDSKRSAGLKTLRELHTKISDPIFGTIDDPDLVMVPNLTISQARFVNQPARVAPIDVDNTQLPWGAILGVDFLKRNFCIIDCGGLTIYFRGARLTPEQATGIAESLRRSGFSPLPFRGNLRLVIASTINGRPMDWMVDTGARYTILEESTRVQLKIPLVRADNADSFMPTSLEGRASGVNTIGLGTKETHAVRLSELSVSDRNWKEIYATTLDASLISTTEHEPAAGNVHGLFGADLLMIHGAVIDFASDTIWLPPQH